jgi:hypothetical protein
MPLAWLLFLGSSVHVAATLGLLTFAEVRAHTRRHLGRYLVAPPVLLSGAVTASLLLPPRSMSLTLLGFFCWQLWHYQKQNLGLASLASTAGRLPALGRIERRCITASGVGGILALVAHPDVLQIIVWRPPATVALATQTLALLVLSASITTGVVCLIRRRTTTTSAAAVYIVAVAFPLPLVLSRSPYAAIGGMTLAHGLQYLLLVGHVVLGPPPRRSWRPGAARLLAVSAVVIAAAGVLSAGSHLHDAAAPAARVLFGAYLAAVMAHFVLDAGLWRLRDEFPRRWLGERIPQLLGRSG